MTQKTKEQQDVSVYAIVPAAGSGTRMRLDTPKQYVEIHAKTVLQWTLEALLEHEKIDALVVGCQSDDSLCHAVIEAVRGLTDKPVYISPGGESRAQTVCHALDYIIAHTDATMQQYALVHDAARPCVSYAEINDVIHSGLKHGGAIVALPVADTIKREVDGVIESTVPRDNLWRALTPQFFPLIRLKQALTHCLGQHQLPTDEAQAMEWLGVSAKLVPGRAANIKLTYADDIDTISHYLSQKGAI